MFNEIQRIRGRRKKARTRKTGNAVKRRRGKETGKGEENTAKSRKKIQIACEAEGPSATGEKHIIAEKGVSGRQISA